MADRSKIPVSRIDGLDEKLKDLSGFAQWAGIDGIKGDYYTTYGIIDAPNSVLTITGGMEVVVKQGVKLRLPITGGIGLDEDIRSDLSYIATSESNCYLFYVRGNNPPLMEVAQIVYSRTEPDNGQSGVIAWWSPDNKVWKFKSNDTGNVWASAWAGPLGKLNIPPHSNTITSTDSIGFCLLNDKVYALRGIPDYSAGVSVTYPYTAPKAGLFTAGTGSGADVIIVNDVNTGLQFNGGNSASVIVAAGDVVTVSGTGPAACKFFPLKGATNA